MSEDTPDPFEILRHLQARDSYDAAFIAAILELEDRLAGLAEIVVKLRDDQDTLKEIYHTLSDQIGALAFLSALRDKRVEAKSEQVMLASAHGRLRRNHHVGIRDYRFGAAACRLYEAIVRHVRAQRAIRGHGPAS
jgi:hypothetical protein